MKYTIETPNQKKTKDQENHENYKYVNNDKQLSSGKEFRIRDLVAIFKTSILSFSPYQS